MWIWGTVKVHPATYCSAGYIEMQEEVDKTATSWTVWDQTLAVKPMQLYKIHQLWMEKKKRTETRIWNSFSYFVSLNHRREIWEEISQLIVHKVRPQAKTWTVDENNFLLFSLKYHHPDFQKWIFAKIRFCMKGIYHNFMLSCTTLSTSAFSRLIVFCFIFHELFLCYYSKFSLKSIIILLDCIYFDFKFVSSC